MLHYIRGRNIAIKNVLQRSGEINFRWQTRARNIKIRFHRYHVCADTFYSDLSTKSGPAHILTWANLFIRSLMPPVPKMELTGQNYVHRITYSFLFRDMLTRYQWKIDFAHSLMCITIRMHRQIYITARGRMTFT